MSHYTYGVGAEESFTRAAPAYVAPTPVANIAAITTLDQARIYATAKLTQAKAQCPKTGVPSYQAALNAIAAGGTTVTIAKSMLTTAEQTCIKEVMAARATTQLTSSCPIVPPCVCPPPPPCPTCPPVSRRESQPCPPAPVCPPLPNCPTIAAACPMPQEAKCPEQFVPPCPEAKASMLPWLVAAGAGLLFLLKK